MNAHFGSYPSLRDKTVFNSGGASAIGAEIVSALAAQGRRVVILDMDEGTSVSLVEATDGDLVG